MFPEIIMQAGEIVEYVLNQGGDFWRCKASEENKLIIDELISVASYSPFLVWSVMGSVGTQTAYFTIRAKYTAPKPEGTVIEVDFKARKVLSKAS